ncbi:hypothetical protein AMATHDRAFT_2085 [Amanita thiersii Skay4041]|uniref:Sucraseferredoxin-like protein n=1 Tax=Amanita thiersii Skay4041 TaxID=703135 RepID=A0A2A9NXN8_9AGAR|nr:hypothetical protein AMATHDRAFT_2085 [Amanita thiersii Skay4041]
MFSLRKLQALVYGQQDELDIVQQQLRASDVPVTSADCRSCPNPCDQGHDGYPARFTIDTDSQMLGSVKPYRRQVFISTGKSDWDREISETEGSLAALLVDVQNSDALKTSPLPQANGKAIRPTTSGIFRSVDSTRISILNGSHHSLSCKDDRDTVLVFPDYKLVSEVHRTKDGAQTLWEAALDPGVGRTGAILEKSSLKSWVIPYACVVLLCSHKRRDNRCAIAAPKLEHAFTQYLEGFGWHVDTDVDASTLHDAPPLEDLDAAIDDMEFQYEELLRQSSSSKRVLIVRSSHVGGHKYAGNCIIYTPQGSCVWYGRVSPHEVESIVVNTIMDGLVLPPLLRGGLNLSRPGCKTLHDW